MIKILLVNCIYHNYVSHFDVHTFFNVCTSKWLLNMKARCQVFGLTQMWHCEGIVCLRGHHTLETCSIRGYQSALRAVILKVIRKSCFRGRLYVEGWEENRKFLYMGSKYQKNEDWDLQSQMLRWTVSFQHNHDVGVCSDLQAGTHLPGRS